MPEAAPEVCSGSDGHALELSGHFVSTSLQALGTG